MVWKATLAISSLLLLTAAADDWKLVTGSVTGSKYYVKAGDMANEADYSPVAWVKVDARGNRTVNWRTSMTRYRIDCRARAYTILAYVLYDAAGSNVDGQTYEPYQQTAQPTVPDSVFEPVMKALCPSGS